MIMPRYTRLESSKFFRVIFFLSEMDWKKKGKKKQFYRLT